VFVDVLIDNDEKVASNLKNISISRLECKSQTLFKMAKIDTVIPGEGQKTPEIFVYASSNKK